MRVTVRCGGQPEGEHVQYPYWSKREPWVQHVNVDDVHSAVNQEVSHERRGHTTRVLSQEPALNPRASCHMLMLMPMPSHSQLHSHCISHSHTA